MHNSTSSPSFLRLHRQAALKRLESPFVYHTGRDELYEIDEAAESFLVSCDGTLARKEKAAEDKFVAYCIDEGLIEILSQPELKPIRIDRSPVPSLRYLELQLTSRCNLKCRHCYLGIPNQNFLPLDAALGIVREFSSNGGLRLLISGGEPLAYPYLEDFIRQTADLRVRRVILTNGTLIDNENIKWLTVDNIQFSLDGWRTGHDRIRGEGSFDKTLRGIYAAREAGVPVSIATMIHSGNLKEFERLRLFAEEIEATEWGIDVPCVAGSLIKNTDLVVSTEDAVPLMKYSYGGGYHGSSDGFACGRHLITVLPTGIAVKCGFYADAPLGDARSGLMECWQRLEHIPLDNLECKGCPVIEDCAGGCRFRAPRPLAPDPVMCALHGQNSEPSLRHST
ncbi:radical SAM protein [bacterium]|nr:radical SAM protein [bacterium]